MQLEEIICPANNAWLQFTKEICRNFLKLYYITIWTTYQQNKYCVSPIWCFSCWIVLPYGNMAYKNNNKNQPFLFLSKNNIKLYPRFLQGTSCLVLWNSLWICIHASQHVKFPLSFQQSILFTVTQHTVDSIMIKIWSRI